MTGLVIIIIVICITIFLICDSKNSSDTEKAFWTNGKDNSSDVKKMNKRINLLENRISILENKINELENKEYIRSC